MTVHRNRRPELSRLHRTLLRWYRANARPFPWRRTRDPYRILVSEVMAQQTQISRVLEKYPEFLRRFPTLRRLASARRSEVIRAWQGMGYNRRAVNLHRAAGEVVEKFHGRIPSTTPLLFSLAGVGPYTASALACFAFGAQVPTVDTNIRRVLTRLFPRRAVRTGIWQLAAEVLPVGQAYDWNQGLMELGALICTARSPVCGDCPLENDCPSAHRAERLAKPNVAEKLRNGEPSRIYRGRIVEALRSRRTAVPVATLIRASVPDLRPGEQMWFLGLLRALEKDGLVRMVGKGRTMKVSLAG